jgi:hypothetical protein
LLQSQQQQEAYLREQERIKKVKADEAKRYKEFVELEEQDRIRQ